MRTIFYLLQVGEFLAECGRMEDFANYSGGFTGGFAQRTHQTARIGAAVTHLCRLDLQPHL